MNRRSFVKGLLASGVTPSVVPGAAHALGDAPPPVADGMMTNWLGNIVSRPAQYLRPRTYDEVAEAIREAPGRVRVVGSRFSKTPILDVTDATVLDMTSLSAVLGVDGGTVRVQAGCTIYDLSKALFQLGLQIPAFLFTANPTIGGTVAAPTKGDNHAFTGGADTLSAFVREAQLVRHDGTLVTIREDDAEMALLKESYGMMGALVEVTLDVVPLRRARMQTSYIRIDDLLASHELMERSLHGRVMLMPKLGWGVLREYSDITEPGMPDVSFESLIHEQDHVYAKVARACPEWLAKPLLQLGLQTSDTEVGDQWHIANMTLYPTPRDHRWLDFVQWCVPIAQHVDMLREAIEFCATHPDYPVDGLLETYHLQGDHRFLTRETVIACDPFVLARHESWERFYVDYNALMMTRNGLPFLNQTRNLPDGALVHCFGDRALAWRDALRMQDPKGKLWNPTVDRLLTVPQG